jgi:regulator of cell morphogenesis and NO signaling
MKLNINESLGTLLTQYPVLRGIFEKYRLDYCCGGKQRLKDAAESAGLDLDTLVNELVEVLDDEPSAAAAQDWNQADAETLCRYIVDRHHTFMRRQLPLVRSLFDDVRAAHAPTHGGLIDALRTVFDGLAAEIEMHLEKEEQILFPYIEQIERHLRYSTPMPEVHCGSVQNPIRQMEYEHDNAGEALEKIRQLTGNFQPPPDACEKFKALYDELARLENDLHEHIHLENNILFPKAVRLEQTVNT